MAPEMNSSRKTIQLKPINATVEESPKPGDEDLTVKVPRASLNEEPAKTNAGKGTIKLSSPKAPEAGSKTIQLKPSASQGDEDLTVRVPKASLQDNAGKGTIQLKSSNATKESASSKATVQLKPITSTAKSNAGKGTIRLDANKAKSSSAVDPASKTVNLKGPKASAKTVNLKSKPADDKLAHSDPTINFDSSELADDAGLDDVKVKTTEEKPKEGPLDFLLALGGLAASGYLVFTLIQSMKIYQ